MKWYGIIVLVFAMGVLSTVPAFAETYEVRIPEGTTLPGCDETSSCFIPYEVTVNVEDTVEWTFDSNDAPHILTSGHPKTGTTEIFSSQLTRDAFSYTFEQSGSYPYFCLIHPWEQGIVTVLDNSDNQKSSKFIENPTQQLKNGVALKDIQCKDDRVLVLRTNGSPVCLTERTAERVVEQLNWEILE